MATTTPFDFSNWPPTLSSEQLEELQLRAETYALAHGLLYLPPYPPQAAAAISTRSGPPSAIHAPISLLPSPFPRSLFNHARKLQSEYNRLYSRIAMNAEFLDRVMGAEVGVGTVDEFTGQLWKGWKALRDKGVSQVRSISVSAVHCAHLGCLSVPSSRIIPLRLPLACAQGSACFAAPSRIQHDIVFFRPLVGTYSCTA